MSFSNHGNELCLFMYLVEDCYSQNVEIYNSTLKSTYKLENGSFADFTCLAIANDITNSIYDFKRPNGEETANNVMLPSSSGTTINEVTTMTITRVNLENNG